MVDTRLALEANAPMDTAKPVQQMGQQQNENAMAAEQTLKAHYDALDAREKSRLSSTIVGAAQLKTFLDNDDVEGAHDFLVKRRNALHSRMGAGENIDTQETDAALEMLRSGKVDELKNGVQGLMAAGQVYGILGGKDQPANIQEWQQYNAMSPEDQKRYLEMKRSNQTLNLGGTQMVVGPTGAPVSEYKVTPKETDTPEYNEEVEKAKAEGRGAGETNANATNTMQNMAGTIAAMEALKTSSANAPSGVVENIGAVLSNKSGYGGEAADNQGDFTVRRAAAENAIRQAFRVVGSGGQSDADALPFIQMLPDATDADSVKASKTTAAIEAMKTRVSSLAQQRGIPDPFNQGGGSGKITVTNGQETYEIDEADLPAAQAEGFKPQ